MICLLAAAAVALTSMFTQPPTAFVFLFLCLASIRPLTQVCEARRTWHRSLLVGLGALLAAGALISLAIVWYHEAETWEVATMVYLLMITVGAAGSSMLAFYLNKSFAK